MSGYVMALYLAGLRGIPGEIREAAAIDGATGFALYRHIIIPLLMPVTLSAAILLGTYSLRLFDITVVMTSSGQGFSTDTPALFMFQTTFQSNKFSQGSAIAFVMLILALLLIIPNLDRQRTDGEEPVTLSLSRIWSRTAIYLVLIAFALFFLMPIYVLIVTALQAVQGCQRADDVGTARRGWILGSFATAWDRVSPNFWNSMQITIPTALISSLIGSLNGYIFAKWRFRYHNVVFTLFLFGLFLPYQAVLIPLVQTLQMLRALRHPARPDPDPLHLRHPDHGDDLPLLFRRGAGRTGGRGEDRRRGLLRHLPLRDAADLAARLRGGDHLAVHHRLERFPAGVADPQQPAPRPGHGGGAEPGRAAISWSGISRWPAR